MKKFRFTMETLLKVKLSVEKQLKGEIAEAEARLRLFEAQKAEVQRRLAQARQDHLVRIQSRLDPQALEQGRIGFAALYEKIAACDEKLRVATDERDRIRARLMEAMVERKMLERLKEKQWDAYREESKKEEAVKMDEFLSSRLAGRS